MTKVSLSWGLTFSLACFACSAEAGLGASSGLAPLADIVDPVPGVPDPSADPAVVLIEGNGPIPCAGAMVAPDVVLTARRCVSAAVPTASCPPADGGQLGPQSTPLLAVRTIDGASSAASLAHVQRILLPPGAGPCVEEMALLLLDQSLDGIQPLAVRTTGIARGDHVRTVGFRTARGGSVAVKWVRDHVAVLETSATVVRLGQRLSDDGSGDPAIDESTGEVVAVVSGSDESLASRTDAFLTFIEGGVAQSGASTRARGLKKVRKGPIDAGANCSAAVDCAAGVCVTEGVQRYCSRTCAAHDGCPARFRCEKGVRVEMVCVKR